jgi:hypothetical protein
MCMYIYKLFPHKLIPRGRVVESVHKISDSDFSIFKTPTPTAS